MGVIGAGYFGRFHLKNLMRLNGACRVAGIFDIDSAAASAAAAEFGLPVFPALGRLLRETDAVSIAVPAADHYAVAAEALAGGRHTFLEKPLAANAGEGRRLARAAADKKVKFQIGQLERFNPAWQFLEAQEELRPLEIEAVRRSPFTGRGTDVSVVHDLMIHDLDLTHRLAKSPLAGLQSEGKRTRSRHWDSSRAELRFASGLRARLSADRAAAKKERHFSVRGALGVCNMDFESCEISGEGFVPKVPAGSGFESRPAKGSAFHFVWKGKERPNPLLAELSSFLNCIEKDLPVRVGAREGLEALETADKILLEGSA